MKILILLMACTLRYTIQSQVMFECYNNTDKSVNMSYVYYDNNHHCWISKGWFTVGAYSTFNLNIGNYVGEVFIHGENSINDWSGDYKFCFDPINRFEIRFADNSNCDNRIGFVKYKVTNGKYQLTFE